MDIFNNPSVAAFIGALFAFLLVSATDLRRRYRIRNLLSYLISDNLDHARSKLEAIRTNIALIKEDNKITGAPFMRFPTQSIKDYQFQVLDILDANQKQGLDALIYWMEAIDDLISEATCKATELKDCIKLNAPNAERTLLVGEFISLLEEAEKNLNHFITLAGYYKEGKAHRILEFQHPIGHD